MRHRASRGATPLSHSPRTSLPSPVLALRCQPSSLTISTSHQTRQLYSQGSPRPPACARGSSMRSVSVLIRMPGQREKQTYISISSIYLYHLSIYTHTYIDFYIHLSTVKRIVPPISCITYKIHHTLCILHHKS